jgi:hypothetical protein
MGYLLCGSTFLISTDLCIFLHLSTGSSLSNSSQTCAFLLLEGVTYVHISTDYLLEGGELERRASVARSEPPMLISCPMVSEL